MRIEVELGNDQSGEGVPVRIRLGRDWLAVNAVVDRWLAREHRYFKLNADGGRYILRHDLPSGAWDLTFFDANGPA